MLTLSRLFKFINLHGKRRMNRLNLRSTLRDPIELGFSNLFPCVPGGRWQVAGVVVAFAVEQVSV